MFALALGILEILILLALGLFFVVLPVVIVLVVVLRRPSSRPIQDVAELEQENEELRDEIRRLKRDR